MCIRDRRKILPATTLLEGQYGQTDVFASVPVVMTKNGIQEVVEINLTDDEREKFSKSCKVIKEYIEKAKYIKSHF